MAKHFAPLLVLGALLQTTGLVEPATPPATGKPPVCDARTIVPKLLRSGHRHDVSEIDALLVQNRNCPDASGEIRNAAALAKLVANPIAHRDSFIASFPSTGQEYWIQLGLYDSSAVWLGYETVWTSAQNGNTVAIGKSIDGLYTSDGAFAEGFEYALEIAFEKNPKAVLDVLGERSANDRRKALCSVTAMGRPARAVFTLPSPTVKESQTLTELKSDRRSCPTTSPVRP